MQPERTGNTSLPADLNSSPFCLSLLRLQMLHELGALSISLLHLNEAIRNINVKVTTCLNDKKPILPQLHGANDVIVYMLEHGLSVVAKMSKLPWWLKYPQPLRSANICFSNAQPKCHI